MTTMNHSEADTVALLVALLDAQAPFVHTRFGDGDVFFMSSTGPTLTADGEHWSPRLATQLYESWETLAAHPGRLLVGDVNTYAVSDGCEEQWAQAVAAAEQIRGGPLELVHIEALRVTMGAALPFYLAARADWRRKVFVGPERLRGAARMLNADHVHVPLRTAHADVVRLLNELRLIWPQVVFFAAGRGGKILQGMLAADHPDVTQVDVGSGLDILFTPLRRGTDRLADPAELRAQYRAAGLQV